MACCDIFKNMFTIYQSKVWLDPFHQELRHRRIEGLTLACINIIWGGHGLPHNFKPGIWKLKSHPLKFFLDPVAWFAKQFNWIINEEDFVWLPHLDAILHPWPFSSPRMWFETYSIFGNETLTAWELTEKVIGSTYRPKVLVSRWYCNSHQFESFLI